MMLQRALLFLFMASIPFTDVARAFLGGVAATELLLVVLGLILTAQTLRGRAVVITPGAVFALGLSLLAVLAYLWASIDERVIPIQTAFWVEYGLIYVMVLQFTRQEQLRNAALLGLLTGAALAGAVVLGHWLIGPEQTFFHRWGPEWAAAETRANFRVYGSFNNPLNLAGYFAVIAGASAYVLSASRSVLVVLAAAAYFGLAALVLVATGSKIVLFVLLACGLLFLRRPMVVLACAVGAIALLVSGYADTFVTRLTDNPLESSSVVERTYLLSSFSEMIADRPFLGYGAGNFQDSYYHHYMHPAANLNPRTYTSENVLLETAVQMGLGGTILLVMLTGRALWQGVTTPTAVTLAGRSIRFGPVVLFGVVGFLIVGMIQSMASPSLNYLLFSLIAMLDAAACSRRFSMERDHHGRWWSGTRGTR